MKQYYQKKYLAAYIILLTSLIDSYGQNAGNKEIIEKKLFVVLPLRFTQLQNNNTMLSGIKLGRSINNQFDISMSVYHSFYLNSFKAKANLNGFNEQPRLFINCIGSELSYFFLSKKKLSGSFQILIGWGFMKYDLKAKNFTSRQVNYFAIEPAINTEYKINNTSSIGLGIGYRPIISHKEISYSSDLLSGAIPISKTIPNGVNVIFTLKGFL